MMAKKAAYDIGHGKPPVETRFEKGKSGNPKGRPRKAKPERRPPDLALQSSRSLLAQEAHRSQRVTIEGITQDLPVLEVAARAVSQKAMQGSRLHFKLLYDGTMEEEARIHQQERDHWKWMRERKALGEQRIADAKAKGQPEPLILPHPDDIKFGPGVYEVRITGPEDEQELAAYQFKALAIKLLLWRSERRRRKGFKPDWAFNGEYSCSFEVCAQIFNELSHPRFKLSEEAFLDAVLAAERASDKAIETEIAQMREEQKRLKRNFPTLHPDTQSILDDFNAKIKRDFKKGWDRGMTDPTTKKLPI